MSDWLPIETAPKGVRITLCGTGWEAEGILFDGGYSLEDVRQTDTPMVVDANMHGWRAAPPTSFKWVTKDYGGDLLP